MPRLHLGVIDIAYSDPDASGARTTGDVAEILESKYHVMQLFADSHADELADLVADAIAGQLESARSGMIPRIPEIDVQKLDAAFRDFLDSNEIQRLLPVRIAAADEGVSHRFKNAKNRTIGASDVVKRGGGQGLSLVAKKPRGPRPAFIDTGLYQASFRSWITP